MKKLAVVLTAVFGLSLAAHADFTWGVSNADPLLDSTGAPMPGSKTDGNAGYFVQLMYSVDGVVDMPTGPVLLDPLSAGGDLAAALDLLDGDDIVVDYAHVGQNSGFFNPANGNFAQLVPVTDEVDDGLYYLRAWEAPSANFGQGALPDLSGGSVNFGVSALVPNSPGTGGDIAGVPPDNLTFPGFQASSTLTVGVIPEPTTFGLLGLGFLGMVIARRKRRA